MTGLRALLLAAVAGSALLAEPLRAQEAPAGEAAIATLLEQARFWRNQDRQDLALRAYRRVLAADPNRTDALAGAAEAQARLGDRAGAEAHLARLRQVAPTGDERSAQAIAALRGAVLDPAGLAEARRLAREGRGEDAVARYRTLFGAAGTPPDAVAVEFYLTLGGIGNGHGEAREGLQRLAARAPGDARLQLALAQLLTWREGTRADGIARLRVLAGRPDTSAAAIAAWRQAVMWMGSSYAAVPELEALVQAAPGDRALAARLEEARQAPRIAAADPAADARMRGFDRLNASRTREAGQDFEAALARSPNDADALGGLGVVRLRQGRVGEARQLLERAIAAAPDRAGQWRPALEGATYGAELAEARAQVQRGEHEAAEATLRRAMRREVPDRADAQMMLGQAALRRGDAPGAERLFRAALTRRPDFGAAVAGLRDSLRRQGREEDASALGRQRRAETSRAAEGSERQVRALREEAARTADPEAAAALLRAALAQDPRHAWVRLDLARILMRQGQREEARTLVEEPLAGRNGNAEAAYAAALLAEEDGRVADVVTLLDRHAQGRRGPLSAGLLARARAEAEVREAVALAQSGRAAEARRRLMAIAARPDSGEGAGAAVRALAQLGDRAGAAEAARAALATRRDRSAGSRVALAGALLDAGMEAEALGLVRMIEADRRLTEEERRQAASLRAGIAVRNADRLNERGQRAAAYEQLAPVLERDPSSPAANLALARLHQGHRQPAEARRIAEAVLARDPRNLDARLAAAELALAAGDRARAETLLAEARVLHPNDARVMLLDARFARASGDDRRALRLLEAAAAQRRAQLGQDTPLTPDPVPTPGRGNPFREVVPMQAVGGVAQSGASVAPTDRIAAEILRELEQTREAAASRLQFTAGVRTRSGTPGLDRLQEVSAAAEAALAAGGGRITARVTPVAIDSGTLGAEPATRRRFGTNALAGPGGGPSARESSASGVSLGLGYTIQGGRFAADIGTTPLGFRTTNLLGGIEFAPQLNSNLRLRLTGERRAVTDSLLSWAGARDTRTGQIWGGVTRTGGRAQLEYTTGPATFYAGGGWSMLDGENVQRNTRTEFGAGASVAVIRESGEELTVGADILHMAYERNQRHFSFGHGGYFSPQSYTALNIPLDWRVRSGALSWRLGATIGYASWREDPTAVFPSDPALQQGLQAAAAGDPTLALRYPGQSRSGVIGGLRGDIEYAVTPTLAIGGLLRYDQAANWSETRGMLFARYRLP